MAKPSTELRSATLDDMPELAEMFAETCRHAYRDVLPQPWLARYTPDRQIPRWTEHRRSLPPNRQITVASQDSRIVGFVEGTRTAASGQDRVVGNLPVGGASILGEVDYLFVHPATMGTGVGRLLLSAEEARLAATGVDAAILWVFSANQQARVFYERCGWAFTGHEQLDAALKKDGFSVYECLYHKPLR